MAWSSGRRTDINGLELRPQRAQALIAGQRKDVVNKRAPGKTNKKTDRRRHREDGPLKYLGFVFCLVSLTVSYTHLTLPTIYSV